MEKRKKDRQTERGEAQSNFGTVSIRPSSRFVQETENGGGGGQAGEWRSPQKTSAVRECVSDGAVRQGRRGREEGGGRTAASRLQKWRLRRKMSEKILKRGLLSVHFLDGVAA